MNIVCPKCGMELQFVVEGTFFNYYNVNIDDENNIDIDENSVIHDETSERSYYTCSCIQEDTYEDWRAQVGEEEEEDDDDVE